MEDKATPWSALPLGKIVVDRYVYVVKSYTKGGSTFDRALEYQAPASLADCLLC